MNIKEEYIEEIDEIKISNLVIFQKEISNPMLVKKEIDNLIHRLKKFGCRHTHRVITKVLSRNEQKRTITLQIMVPVIDAEKIDLFIKKYQEYRFLETFQLNQSLKISIPNETEAFKKAVNTFVQYSDVKDINGFGKDNHVIEIAKVDVHGTVIGFDLHLERK